MTADSREVARGNLSVAHCGAEAWHKELARSPPALGTRVFLDPAKGVMQPEPQVFKMENSEQVRHRLRE